MSKSSGKVFILVIIIENITPKVAKPFLLLF